MNPVRKTDRALLLLIIAGLVTYVAVSLVTKPAQLRGLDIAVARDLDDALDAGEKAPELAAAT